MSTLTPNERLGKWQSFAAMNLCRKEVCLFNSVQQKQNLNIHEILKLTENCNCCLCLQLWDSWLISNDSLFLNVGSEFKQIDDIYTSMPLWIFNIVCIFALYVRFYLKTRLHCSKKNKTKNTGLAGRIWCLEVGGLGFKFKGCPVRHVPKLVFHNFLLDAVLSLLICCLHAKP